MMLKYDIKIEGKNNPRPIMTFEDDRYELAATFLLAEARNFGSAIVDALGEVTDGRKSTGTFAGNVFSLEITPETTTICDDISGEDCEIGTEALREIAEEYVEAYESLQ